MTTALPTAPSAYGLKGPSAAVTVDNATPQGSTYLRGNTVQTNGASSLSVLRKFALSLLRQDKQYPKRSLRGRRKTTDRLPDYRALLLGLAPRG